jgi:glutamyl-tRNA(Gln) amidotransferase subunit E
VQESGVAATTVAVFLTESLKALKRDGVPVENVLDQQIKDLFYSVGRGELAKEATADVFSWLSKNPDRSVEEAMAVLGFKMLSAAELDQLVDEVIFANKAAVEKQGKGAFGLVMGLVMKQARGKASPEAVSKLVKQKLP